MKRKSKKLQDNQRLVLEHLQKVTNKKMFIPVLSLKKSFSYEKLVEEVKNLTDNGKKFIKEFMVLIKNTAQV